MHGTKKEESKEAVAQTGSTSADSTNVSVAPIAGGSKFTVMGTNRILEPESGPADWIVAIEVSSG
jgi:hypothetical protein